MLSFHALPGPPYEEGEKCEAAGGTSRPSGWTDSTEDASDSATVITGAATHDGSGSFYDERTKDTNAGIGTTINVRKLVLGILCIVGLASLFLFFFRDTMHPEGMAHTRTHTRAPVQTPAQARAPAPSSRHAAADTKYLTDIGAATAAGSDGDGDGDSDNDSGSGSGSGSGGDEGDSHDGEGDGGGDRDGHGDGGDGDDGDGDDSIPQVGADTLLAHYPMIMTHGTCTRIRRFVEHTYTCTYTHIHRFEHTYTCTCMRINECVRTGSDVSMNACT